MTTIAAITAVLSVGVLTYLSRAGLILFLAERPLPLQIQRALRYVGPAVLSALTVTLVAGSDGVSGVEFAEVTAIAAGGIVAALTRNLIASLVAGMAVLWLVLLST
ncbi:MAG: AzlD domain-containing protein [Ilumatobacteraceae bacterium]|nr:AzlD domain-containing protein [Ilumatobacteraceae bacterium]